MKSFRFLVPIIVIVVALILDQWLKIYIKLNFSLGECYHIFDWFNLCFIENPGMAFGMSLGSKVFLTIFRLVASACILWYIIWLVRSRYSMGYIVVISLILAGAMGNLLDCVFYGVLFSESTPYEVAEFCALGEGYAPWLLGNVVDMFYFPLFTIPQWVPLVGGDVFFSPVFNLADSYITVCVIVLILFYSKDFGHSLDKVFSRKSK